MVGKTTSRSLIGPLLLLLLLAPILMPSSSALSQSAEGRGATGELERSFEDFLAAYRPEMRRRNRAYLKSVHPKLPEEMYDFFFDVTLQMIRFAEDEGLEPTVECQDFKVCRAVYPQPDDGWAAQRFILHDGAWRWLDQ